MDVPTLLVDTTNGYQPAVSDVGAFVARPTEFEAC